MSINFDEFRTTKKDYKKICSDLQDDFEILDDNNGLGKIYFSDGEFVLDKQEKLIGAIKKKVGIAEKTVSYDQSHIYIILS